MHRLHTGPQGGSLGQLSFLGNSRSMIINPEETLMI